jgi:hypothetical protein
LRHESDAHVLIHHNARREILSDVEGALAMRKHPDDATARRGILENISGGNIIVDVRGGCLTLEFSAVDCHGMRRHRAQLVSEPLENPTALNYDVDSH